MDVFTTSTPPHYAALTRAAFPGVENLPPNAQGEDSQADPAKADAYTGYWERDAPSLGE